MKRATSSLASFYKVALQGLEAEKERIESEIRTVRALYARQSGGVPVLSKVAVEAPAAGKTRKVRNLSAAARARIAAAQKKRWAEFRKSPKA